MIWLILLVSFALVLAPVMWILPSPAQKSQAKMRECARKLSLQVRVGPLPQTHKQKVRKESSDQGVCYTALLRRKITDTVPAWQWWPEVETELPAAAGVSPQQLAAMKTAIEQSGLTVKMVEYNHTGLSCWWRETGEEPAVLALAKLQTDCLDILNVSAAMRTHRESLA